MSNSPDEMIAVCGLDCGGCDIRMAATDKEMAQKIADWFKKKLNEEVKLEDIQCSWCRGDREKHWSPDCWILQCCVDEKGLSYCHECDDFACEKLEEWGRSSEKYQEGLDRLKRMKEGD